MNNFERRMFLDYSEKLIDSLDVDSHGFENLFDFVVNEFKLDKKHYKYDRYNNLKTDTREERCKFKEIFIKDIKKSAKQIKPANTLFEKKCKIIKELYSLDDIEYQIFLFHALKEVNNIFNQFFGCFNGDAFDIFASDYLKLRSGKKERIVSDLAQRDVINYRGRRSSYSINYGALQVFDSSNCNTPEKIMNKILGKKEKSSLKLSDYDHIKDKRDMAIKILDNAIKQKKKGVNILLYGEPGTGKSEFARLLPNYLNVPIYAIQTEKDDFKEATRSERLADLYSKQNILSKTNSACLLFDEAEDVLNRGFSAFGSASKGYLNKLLENVSVPVIWTTNNIYDVDPAFLRRFKYCLEFEKLSEVSRLNIWNKTLKKNKFKVSKTKVEELNKNYNISPSLIVNAIETTKMIGGDESNFEELIENVATVVHKKKNIKEKKDFDPEKYNIDLVNADIDVNNLASKILKSGKLNFSICMYGEPGVGKSEYGKYLANLLGLEVIYKRASDLKSKWVGETEQNIARAFAEAKEKKAMLIFDEADSFLQARNGDMKSWEIGEVNEFLTQMESHDYPFICTTNLMETLDEATLRRFTFKIKFDFMNDKQVNLAFEHFLGIKNTSVNIKGLTAGDFAVVKKKADFLEVKDVKELTKMLEDEVKVKKSKTLKNSIGF